MVSPKLPYLASAEPGGRRRADRAGPGVALNGDDRDTGTQGAPDPHLGLSRFATDALTGELLLIRAELSGQLQVKVGLQHRQQLAARRVGGGSSQRRHVFVLLGRLGLPRRGHLQTSFRLWCGDVDRRA
jgi:hypothetical protein